MQRILVIWCVGLVGACAAGRPSTTAAPPPRPAAVARAQPVDVPAPKPSAEVPLSLEPDRQEKEEDAMLCKAVSLYREFIDRAGSDPTYAEAARRSRERIADIEAILTFRAEGRGEHARKQCEAE
jgi:hypothetical protein